LTVPEGGTFESAYAAYRPAIRRHLARLVGETEADDLTQEVFVKALAGLADLRDPGRLKAWLYRVATNTALDRLRRAARATLRTFDEDQMSDTARPSGGRAVPLPVESQAIRREMSACVRAHVDRLPEAQRTVLVLSEIEGHTDAEIATLVGTSVGNVKIRLHRARTRLRADLTRSCRLYPDSRNELACEPVVGSTGEAPPIS
jgi:RNA polymerase sigma-70 factor, ECF subfamily